MKKKLIILISLFSLFAFNAQAQSILDILKGLSSKKTEQTDSVAKSDTTQTSSSSSSKSSIVQGLGNIVVGLLGTDKVSSYSMYGKWNYTKPAITFESENFLTNMGGMAASQALANKMQTYLDKIGFTAGTLQMNFNEDGTGAIVYKTKNIPFQWSVQDSDLTINLASGTLSKLTSSSKLSKYTSFKMNCKMNLTEMQLSFKADKFAEFLKKVINAVGSKADSSAISGVAGIANKIEGMYLGLSFGK